MLFDELFNRESSKSNTPPEKSFRDEAKECLEKRKVTISEYDLANAFSSALDAKPVRDFLEDVPISFLVMTVLALELREQLFDKKKND